MERTVGGGQAHCVRLGLYSQVTIASDLPAQSSGVETLRKDHFRRSDAYSQLLRNSFFTRAVNSVSIIKPRYLMAGLMNTRILTGEK